MDLMCCHSHNDRWPQGYVATKPREPRTLASVKRFLSLASTRMHDTTGGSTSTLVAAKGRDQKIVANGNRLKIDYR